LNIRCQSSATRCSTPTVCRTVVLRLKPFEDRAGSASSAQAAIREAFSKGANVRQANVVAFNLPPIIDLSVGGGFESVLEALERQEPAVIDSVMGGIIAGANKDPALARVSSSYNANNPSIYIDIDRAKAQAFRLAMNDVFAALQRTFGGFYVIKFNILGRTWQVNFVVEAAKSLYREHTV